MSLSKRIIISATVVLVIFLTLTAAALERAFSNSAESALRDKLTSQLYALMAVAEVDATGIQMPTDELDALLGLPSSGMYAFVTDKMGKILWQSSSALGAIPPRPLALSRGNNNFKKTNIKGIEYYTFAYGVNWATDAQNTALTFNISTDLQSFNQQIKRYRNTLWAWLLAMAALLLISQTIIMRWGLQPLRKVATELNLIESGDQDKIEDHYPEEIERLTQNINQLLQQERKQKKRYRDALGDLAHSLKTPLAVLQSNVNSDNKTNSILQEQLTRMDSIVEYQLQRAATAGSFGIGKSIAVKTVLTRILDSLKKVHRDKALELNITVDDALTFKGDEGDLMELLGNVLDNAFKWAQHRIEISAEIISSGKLQICIVDDGPGIRQEDVDELLRRGVRADQSIDGHGIGLSIVRNIIEAYEGTLKIDPVMADGSSTGAKVIITL